MRSSRSRSDDDLGVLISLTIAVGMLIGAVAAMWIWNTMSESIDVLTIGKEHISKGALAPE
jgi:hypothetical protein